MALNTGVVGANVVHTGRIQSVAARWMRDVLAPGTVATFAAYIPLRHLLGLDVVADGVTAVAGGTGGPLHIVRGIERRPPVGSIGDEIWSPNAVGDIPLGWFGKIIIAALGEITLLPNAAVDQGDLVFRESGDGVGGEIGNDGVGKFARIANDIGHRSFSPAFVELRVTLFAGFGADVMRGTCGG